MEDILDLYEEPYDPNRPEVCFEETNKQLITETKVSEPAKAGQAQPHDYEYMCNGTIIRFQIGTRDAEYL